MSDQATEAAKLQRYPAKLIEHAKCQLNCQNYKCLKTYIECDKYFKEHEELERLKRKIKAYESNANSSLMNEMPKNEVVQKKHASSQCDLHQLSSDPFDVQEKDEIIYIETVNSGSSSNVPPKKRRKEEQSHQQQENKSSGKNGAAMACKKP